MRSLNLQFLSALEKLRKATISLLTLSVRPHAKARVPMDSFRAIRYSSTFGKTAEIIQVSLKYDKD